MGPTAWKTYLACKRPAPVATALPVGQRPILRHSSMMLGPPARWMAPSTPPPPASAELAALTMASASTFVISPCCKARVIPLMVYVVINTSPKFISYTLKKALAHVILREAKNLNTERLAQLEKQLDSRMSF